MLTSFLQFFLLPKQFNTTNFLWNEIYISPSEKTSEKNFKVFDKQFKTRKKLQLISL